VTPRDWVAWHERYDDAGSHLPRRLALVQGHLERALDGCPDGPIRVVSMCAGQGRDLLGVLPQHPRRDDIRARLVELDERNVAAARQTIADHDLSSVEVLAADAGTTDAYAGAVPADVVLACGVFGNVTDHDVEQTVRVLPSLCAPRATVIWTRHRFPPDRTPDIRAWFEQAGFAELAFDAPDADSFSVGANRFGGDPQPFVAGRRLFDFVGFDSLHTLEADAGH
jgi:hypothetical protein